MPGPSVPYPHARTVARANAFLALCCDGFPFGREDNGLRLTSGTCMKVPRGTGPDINCTLPLAGRVSMRFGATSPTLEAWINSPSLANHLRTSLFRSDMTRANDGARESKTKRSEGGDRQLENNNLIPRRSFTAVPPPLRLRCARQIPIKPMYDRKVVDKGKTIAWLYARQVCSQPCLYQDCNGIRHWPKIPSHVAPSRPSKLVTRDVIQVSQLSLLALVPVPESVPGKSPPLPRG